MTEKKKEKLEECQKLKEEYLSGWQRSRADFLNYKKEEAKRLKKLLQYEKERTIISVLPMVDAFERATQGISKKAKEDSVIKGFLQIKKQLKDFLQEQEVEEIKALGEKFDPNFHEAIEMVEGKKKNIVMEEIEKGYQLQGKVIRPAKVKISK